MPNEASGDIKETRTPGGGRWSKGAVFALLLILAAIATFIGAPLDLWLGCRSPGSAEVTTNPAPGAD